MAETPDGAATDRFVLGCSLAWAGGTIAYTPLLTILLPVRVVELAGKQAGVDWLAYVALVGAVAASLGGICFGYLSDVTRNRRGWIAAGLVLSCLLLGVIDQVTSLIGLLIAIACWQLALNMMLGPLAAWAGDVVPDHRKGLLGGLMAFAPGIGALTGALVTLPGLAAGATRIWLVAAMVAACVLPVLLMRSPPRLIREWPASSGPAEHLRSLPVRRSVALHMWLARLLVQVAEATMFAYLFFWLLSLDSGISDNQAARVFSAVLLSSAPLALLVGRWSDRAGRPIAPLQLCAMVSALGLTGMALATDLTIGLLAYGVFGLASAVFLALHSSQTLRILPRPDRRGRDLGLFNLANTFPSLVMPWLAVSLVPAFGYNGLFGLLAVLAGMAGLLLGVVARNA